MRVRDCSMSIGPSFADSVELVDGLGLYDIVT